MLIDDNDNAFMYGQVKWCKPDELFTYATSSSSFSLSNLSFKLKPSKISVNFDSLIEKVIFNGPATIIIWKDGTKTVVKCMDGDDYDREKGFMMAIIEYLLGGTKGDVKRFFKKHIPEEESVLIGSEDIKDVISSMMNSVLSFGFHKEEDKEDDI